MSTFNYDNSKNLALRLVEKFGGECKIETATKTQKAKAAFMANRKTDKADGPIQTQTKTVYVAGTNLEIQTNNRLVIKNDIYLVIGVELYNFDNSSKILYILTVAK